MREKWKDIKGFEGRYQVSDLGNVRSVTHTDNMHWFSTGSKRIKKGRILKTTKKDGKYHVVNLYYKKHNSKYVHRLVAETFISEIPKGMVVNHIDGIIDNNRLDNLEITNHRSNAIHAKLRTATTSNYPGVSWNKARKCWISMAKNKGKSIYLGGYTDEKEAHEKYMNYVESIDEIKYTLK